MIPCVQNCSGIAFIDLKQGIEVCGDCGGYLNLNPSARALFETAESLKVIELSSQSGTLHKDPKTGKYSLKPPAWYRLLDWRSVAHGILIVAILTSVVFWLGGLIYD